MKPDPQSEQEKGRGRLVPADRDGRPLSASRVRLIRLFLAVVAGVIAGVGSTAAVAALVEGLNPQAGPALLHSPLFIVSLVIAFVLPAILVGVRLFQAFGDSSE